MAERPERGLTGRRQPRVEDARLLCGQGQFVDDLRSDCPEVAFVRSPHAHARILDIDVSAVLELDGVLAVYTHEDLPAPTRQRLPVSIPHAGLRAARTPYALARSEVNHVGEAVAMVVARDRYVAEDACRAITVRYEVLPPCVGIDAAIDAQVRVHADVPDNVAGVINQESGDVEAALQAAEHVIDVEVEIERSMASPIEGRGVYARTDPVDGTLRVYTSTQVPHAVRASLSHMLGRPMDDIEVVAPDVGGAFGVKGVRPWPEEVLVAWAAQHFTGGVKWTEDRHEHFVSSAHERGQRQRVRIGFDGSGRVCAYDVDIQHDVGAYTQYGLVVSQNTSSHVLGPYAVAAKRVTVTALYTNTVMAAPYRGAGRPEGTFALERAMDRVAEYLGLDRLVVRERNLIRPEQMPYAQGLRGQDGQEVVYDSGDYPSALQRMRELVGWDDFAAIREEARARGRRVGIGLACYVENTGIGPYEGAEVTVTSQGSVRVAVGAPAQGQGHETVLAQVMADELGVRVEDVEVVAGDTRALQNSVGTFASRGAVTLGSAVHLAGAAVRARALEVASQVLEADPDDLELVDGVVQVVGSPGSAVALGTLATLANTLRYPFLPSTKDAAGFTYSAQLPETGSPGLTATAYFSPPQSTYANGVHAVVVETDPQTAEVRILRYCVVHDCGRVLNPMLVEGQIHGGVAQGIAGALYERMAYDEHGQLQNASFMDFLMPFATEVPSVEIDHLETPSPGNPLGVKGAGEAGVIPASAAFASAIEDAEGLRVTRMPMSPSDLFALRLNAGAQPALCL
jgi:CO/xanthine dehydrogenase Mo-binding subunit